MKTNLETINQLQGRMFILLSDKPEPISSEVYNTKARQDAIIEKMWFEVQWPGSDLLREVAIEAPTIKMRSLTNHYIEHDAPNGSYFTVADLLDAVKNTDMQTRALSDWMGGMDVHHTYFEGLVLADDGIFDIRWGS